MSEYMYGRAGTGTSFATYTRVFSFINSVLTAVNVSVSANCQTTTNQLRGRVVNPSMCGLSWVGSLVYVAHAAVLVFKI